MLAKNFLFQIKYIAGGYKVNNILSNKAPWLDDRNEQVKEKYIS